ncbi:VOC family protein [Blastococcus sp. URHD0036]|uniref:bleomycin resistance protein n=1 Tax=Blastococcus sp. URHD0036 TaxID=1380356 RepID=UPI00049579BB|nr:VOC family protein [Blastococcus sp. URHD0036]
MDDVEVRASPILPVADLRHALEHYASLGFVVSEHDGDYGFAAWRGLELHLVRSADHDPARTATAVFLHVRDADEVARAWAGAPGTTAPTDRPWGVREGAHVDPDGNLLRFGSPIPSAG